MTQYFSDIVGVEFTANMEKELDSIEEGRVDWEKVIREEDRNLDYLKSVVRAIVAAVCATEMNLHAMFPQLSELKARLLDSGAVYAAMSGSGSSVFGIFESANMADCDKFADFGNVFDIVL